jgi:hypothetical protein
MVMGSYTYDLPFRSGNKAINAITIGNADDLFADLALVDRRCIYLLSNLIALDRHVRQAELKPGIKFFLTELS